MVRQGHGGWTPGCVRAVHTKLSRDATEPGSTEKKKILRERESEKLNYIYIYLKKKNNPIKAIWLYKANKTKTTKIFGI